MNKKIFLLTILFFTFSSLINAQNTSIEEINSFIKNNSSGYQNYWARINVINNNLIIHNSAKAEFQKYTFPINKINLDAIKHSKKALILKANEPGEHVLYKFVKERKESVATILIYGMEKSNRIKLKELVSALIKGQKNNKLKESIKLNKSDQLKINQLISDLFINFELSNKNYNLSSIFNYVTDIKKSNINQINLTSNLGHNSENVQFIYNNGNLNRIKYSVDRKEGKGFILFDYHLTYLKNHLKSINIKGKEKYQFKYAKNKLISVTQNSGDIQRIYHINYNIKEKIASLELNVKRSGKLYEFTNKNHKGIAKDKVIWNNNFQTNQFWLDTYASNNIIYDNLGNISSFNFTSVNSNKNPIIWEYTFDQNKNWIQLKKGKALVKRKIIYN